MLKRNTSLIAILTAVIVLVSLVTIFEVRAAARDSISYSTGTTEVIELDLGYVQFPAGTVSSIPAGYYYQRTTVVQGATTATVELISYSGTVVTTGTIPVTYTSGSGSGMEMAAFATAAPATAVPAPSQAPVSPSPSASPSLSPSPSASPSPSPSPKPQPGQLIIDNNGITVRYKKPPFEFELIIGPRGDVTGRITIGFRF